jgi:hypothetical protein
MGPFGKNINSCGNVQNGPFYGISLLSRYALMVTTDTDWRRRKAVTIKKKNREKNGRVR